jgi:hypothetical protein
LDTDDHRHGIIHGIVFDLRNPIRISLQEGH